MAYNRELLSWSPMPPTTFDPFDDWSMTRVVPFETVSRNVMSMFNNEMNMMKHLMHHQLPREIRDVNFRPSSMNEYNTFTHPITYNDDGTRQLRLCYDVRGFKPEEVNVQILSNEKAIIVDAKHEVNEPDHQVMRHFSRRYVLPDSLHVDLAKIQPRSILTPEGNLFIEAQLPRLTIEEMNALRGEKSNTPNHVAHQNVAVPITMK